MKHTSLVLSVVVFTLVSCTPQDLINEEILVPSMAFVLADSSYTPLVKITNESKDEARDFWVKLTIANASTGAIEYRDSVNVAFLGSSSSCNIEFAQWTPGESIEVDTIGNRYNLSVISDLTSDVDTSYMSVASLWKKDARITNIALRPFHEDGRYLEGAVVTITATAQNVGFGREQEIPVECRLIDKTADPDSVVWEGTLSLSVLDWMGNSTGAAFTGEVTFPAWTVPSLNWLAIYCITRLEGDLCPANDTLVVSINTGVAEIP